MRKKIGLSAICSRGLSLRRRTFCLLWTVLVVCGLSAWAEQSEVPLNPELIAAGRPFGSRRRMPRQPLPESFTFVERYQFQAFLRIFGFTSAPIIDSFCT